MMERTAPNAIRALRQRAGMTLRSLADGLAMRPQEMARIEAAVQPPNLDQAIQVCEALGQPFHVVFPTSQSVTRLWARKGWAKEALMREVSNPGPLTAALAESGIDLDCRVWTMALTLRNGSEQTFRIAASTRVRLRDQFLERPLSFAVFDSEDARVGLNLAHTDFVQFLSDPPATTFGARGEELQSGASDGPSPAESVVVQLAHHQQPLEFSIDGDVPDDPVEEGGMGQMQHLLYTAESASEEPAGRYRFEDADGDEVLLLASELSMISVPLWVVEPDVREAMDEADDPEPRNPTAEPVARGRRANRIENEIACGDFLGIARQ